MSGNSNSPGKARARGASELPLLPREAEYFDKLLHLFCANRAGTHGCAQSTVNLYAACMKRAVRAIGLPPWAWEPRDVDLLLDAMCRRGLTVGTQVSAITVLRAFQGYLLEDIGLCNEIQQQFGVRPERFITLENAIPHRRNGRNRSKHPEVLTVEQCTALLDEYQFQIEVAWRQRSKSYQPLRRDFAITVVALSYGLRAAELAGIETTHFLSDPKYPQFGKFAILNVVGKGRKLRSVRLFAPEAAPVLEWYINHVRAPFLSTSTTNPKLLFLSERGCKLCTRQYRRSVGAVSAAAGLPMHVYPHLLRHTYGTHMAKVIGPVALQKQMGHKYLSTTLGTYYHPDPEEVGDEVARGVDAMVAALEDITQEVADANDR